MTGQRFLWGPRISRSPIFAKTLCMLGLTFHTRPGNLHADLGPHVLPAQILRVKDENWTSGPLRSLLNYGLTPVHGLTHVHGLHSQQHVGNLQSMLGISKVPKEHFSPQFFLLNWLKKKNLLKLLFTTSYCLKSKGAPKPSHSPECFFLSTNKRLSFIVFLVF